MSKPSKISIYKIRLQITKAEAILNVCGDFHYGAKGAEKEAITKSLNEVTDLYRDNIFRVFTGDLIENQLKTSVGHGYDIVIPDPAVQKKEMIEILKDTNKYLYGVPKWNRLKIDKNTGVFNNILSVGVAGNHEYRTRKLAAQWISEEMHNASKTLDMHFGGIVELTIYNKKLNLEKTYKIYVAHRPSKTDATSDEAILRAFRKKQSTLPGIDVIVFGHTHKRFIASSSYTDTTTGETKKVLYVVNPSPMEGVEYAEEAGYSPILQTGLCTNVHLPLDPVKQIYGYV